MQPRAAQREFTTSTCEGSLQHETKVMWQHSPGSGSRPTRDSVYCARLA